ncbi:hypothetical protein [Algibacter marinivivus]|uniref:hypothetical protein n=1 Tax=Algibacter marinivivus TaxID=2100723 RepID=UPI0011B25863|nr:hypothetical protein [Algibacter marinivivus]
MIIIFLLFFLTDFISALTRLNLEGKIFREVKISFFILPIVILIQKKLVIKQFANILKSFFYGVLTYIVFVWGYLYYFYTIKHPSFIFDFTDHYVIYVLARETPNSIHHTYIGLYILLITILIFTNTILYKKINTLIGLFLTLFFLINSFYIGGKSTTILLIIFLVIILLKSVFKGVKIKGFKYYILGLILTVLVGVNGIYEWLTVSVKQSLGLRIDIYKRCIEVALEALPFGIGKDKLNNIPLDNNLIKGERLITHNIYFNELIINGFIGLFILLIMIFYICYVGYRSSIIFLLFILSIAITGLIEDLFVRQGGILFFVFFTCIFYVSKQKIESFKLL